MFDWGKKKEFCSVHTPVLPIMQEKTYSSNSRGHNRKTKITEVSFERFVECANQVFPLISFIQIFSLVLNKGDTWGRASLIQSNMQWGLQLWQELKPTGPFASA